MMMEVTTTMSVSDTFFKRAYIYEKVNRVQVKLTVGDIIFD